MAKETKLFEFLSKDWRELRSEADRLFAEELNAIPDDARPECFFGLSGSEVKKLYHKHQSVAANTDRMYDVREKLKDLNNNQIAAIMHLENVRGMLEISSHIMADRNLKNGQVEAQGFEREDRQRKLIADIGLMKEEGYGVKEMKAFLSNIKIWQTFTPHPTKDKNGDGERLFRALTALADIPGEDRAEKARSIIGEMLTTRLTPEAKDTLQKETQDGLAAEKVYVEGMLDYLEDLQTALDINYGDGTIDLTEPDIYIDMAPRDWFSGDADGKYVPAPVLFAKRVRSAQMAVDLYLKDLKNVPPEDAEKLKDIIAVFEQFKGKLDTLGAKVDDIEKPYLVYEGEKNSAKCWEDRAYLAAKKEFAQVFLSAEYKGQTFERGPQLTEAVIGDLRAIIANQRLGDCTRDAALRVVMRHKQVGIAMGRQETRHNSADYEEIFDNLFRYLRREGLAKDVMAHYKNVDNLSELEDAGLQAKFLKDLMKDHNGNMHEWLFAANPDGWARNVLERWAVKAECFNQYRTGAAIIAEALPISPVKQQVIAEAFGIKGVIHVSLNENEKTIKEAADSLNIYYKVFGRSNLEDRTGRLENDEDKSQHYLCVMDPQSDSHKAHGPFIKCVQRQTLQKLIQDATETSIARFVKLGTGASYARGGFSPMAQTRLYMNALYTMDPLKGAVDCDVLKQMACFTSTTIQGRDVGMRFGTPEQVHDMLGGIVENMKLAVLTIDGKADPEIIAPGSVRFSPQMRLILERIEQQCRNHYKKMWERPSYAEPPPALRSNIYLNDVSALTMATKAGVGARQPSRENNPAKKIETPDINVKGQRAIGINISNVNAENLYDGSYTVGMFFRELHQAYKNGEINRQDLIDLRNDHFYMRQLFPNVFAALATADYGHGFDQLYKGIKQWTAGDVRRLEKEDYKSLKSDGNGNGNGSSRLKENTAFHADLTFDALAATAYMEALLETTEPTPIEKLTSRFTPFADGSAERKGFDLSHEEIMDKLYGEGDMLNRLKFGERTLQAIPDIADISRFGSDKRLVRAVQHVFEERIKNENDPHHIKADAKESQYLLHHVACARRTHGPINMEVLVDHTGYGSKPHPLLDYVREDFGLDREYKPAFECETARDL